MKNGRTESVKSQTKTSENAQGKDGEQEQLVEQSGDNSTDKSNGNSTNNAGSSGTGGNAKSDNETQANPLDEHLVNMINEAIDNVMKSAQAKQDVRQVRQAIKQSDTRFNNVGKTSYKSHNLSGDERANARAFGNELIKLQIDNDPAWHRELPSGKLNIQRTMNMDINNLNRLFDRWDNGNEAFDIEAVILIDNSGSMDGQMPDACRSAWTIKKALETIDAKVTVYVFDDETKLLYSADEKANGQEFRFVGAGGSTNPIEGLREAESIFKATKRKTKLLFVVTDGEWYNEDECNKTITNINSIKGTISNLVYITNGYQSNRLDKDELKKSMQRWLHNCHAITLINRPKDIVNVARDVVRSLSNR
jgi:Mg-chelatase subunit ChlD